MAWQDGDDRSGPSARAAWSAISNHFWDVVLTGFAIILPVLITLYLVQMAVDFIRDALTPFIALLRYFDVIGQVEQIGVVSFLIERGVFGFVVDFFAEVIALAILFGIVLIVGSVGHNRYGERVIEFVDLAIASIPGIGTVYKSFRRMGDVMLDNEAENFQDVKLVRCLDENLYVLGFETSAAPATVEDSTGNDEMMTLFIPMAPNPVTGGFLTYVPREDVYDIDMTIEDGVRSILTSGVATGPGAADPNQLSLDDIQNVASVEQLQDALTIDRRDGRK